jgi:structural maintenance of chromosome 3 (chondroitin sulfate proteoglycan 6)
VYPKSSDAFAMIDKLQFDPRFRKAMLQVSRHTQYRAPLWQYLKLVYPQVFGKTMVCRNIDVATQIARQHNFNTITMDGIMLPYCHHGK